jgi:hypothetical protein
MQSTLVHASGSLLSDLSTHKTQARLPADRHLALVPDQNSMIYWLAYVCRTARVNAEPKLKHVEIAVAARQFAARREAVDQSTVSRFEKGMTWPRNADVIVAAYADELRHRGHDVEAADLWAEALRLWRAHLAGDGVSETAA